MRKPYSVNVQLLDEVSENNKALFIRDALVGYLGYTFELPSKQR